MASIFFFFTQLLIVLLTFSGSSVKVLALDIGINYGHIASNLPPPSRVTSLLTSLNIRRAKIYDANPEILNAFANSDIGLTISLDEPLESMIDPVNPRNWVKQKVRPYVPITHITCIIVGNEVFSSGNIGLISSLLPAMKNLHNALVEFLLEEQVTITTSHAFDILASSYPPSSGAFKEEFVEYLRPILDFQAQIKSPFSINAYPYFAYKGNPDEIPLEYVLFQPNNGTTDPEVSLHYDNMLFAQIDAVYSAIKLLGHTDINVIVSETGWPSKGDADEAGATPENAGLYNGNLLRIVEGKQGTPAKPSIPIQVYIFALFNENMKPGPTSERNYGLYNPDTTQVYNIGLQHQGVSSAAPRINVVQVFGLLILAGLCSNIYAQQMEFIW